MTKHLSRLLMAVFTLTSATAIVATQNPAPQTAAPQSPAPPQNPAPPAGGTAPAAPAPQGGRGSIEQQIAMGADFLKRPPVVRLDPAVQQQMFLLPPGYKIEPVLTDPMIEDPVGVTFDGNGRMYVLEMRSYMRDADGSNSREPISRISRH